MNDGENEWIASRRKISLMAVHAVRFFVFRVYAGKGDAVGYMEAVAAGGIIMGEVEAPGTPTLKERWRLANAGLA